MEEDQKEIIKVGAEALVKPVADLINKLFGGAAEQMGGMWTDELAARRKVRQIALYLKVKKAIGGAGFEPQQIPDRIWLPILREASLEDDETLQTKWANLLANAADPEQRNAVLPSFSSIMADLNSVQAKFLEALYKKTLESEGRYPAALFSEDQLADLYVRAGLSQSPRLSHLTYGEVKQGGETLRADQTGFSTTIEVLLRNGILSQLTKVNPIRLDHVEDYVRQGGTLRELEPTTTVRYRLTDVGRQFVRACDVPSVAREARVRAVSATATAFRFPNSPVRDQEVGGSNPLAPTATKVAKTLMVGATWRRDILRRALNSSSVL
jgi:hypothetical protein